MGRNLKMPWSMEDTVENMCRIRDMMIKSVRQVNLDGKGEDDVKEIHFDFNRVEKALKKQIPNAHVCFTDEDSCICGNCGSNVEVTEGYNYCPYCGQRIANEN